MPKYSGFDPIQSHNVVTSSSSFTGASYDSDPVSIYLPFDSDIQDASANNHTVTAVSSADISSTQAKFGGNSLLLNGTSQYLTVANDADFQFGTEDFTIEAWVYQSTAAGSDAADRHNVVSRMASSSNRSWSIDIRQDGGQQRIVFGFSENGSNATEIKFDCEVPYGSWHHIAIVRFRDQLLGFLDGVNLDGAISGHLSSFDASVDIYAGTSDLAIGYRGLSTQYFQGFIDDLRISKGVARYTKSFIPPSQAVGATLNGENETNTTTGFTSLYLPFDSDVNDDSDDPFTITASGGAAISSTQAKFGGNSLGLDGTNDYLTVGSSQSAMAFAGDFTIEYWMYPTSLGGSYVGPMGCHSGTGWLFQFASGGGRFFIDGSNEITTTAATSANQWYHVVVTRSSGTVKLFIDGEEQGSRSFTSAMPTNNDLIIGASNATGQYFPGYLDDIRILDGYAKYTADFVPPTSAVGTSVSETVNDLTVLYMPFDDDSFEDQARNHGVTKSGDTTLSTSVKKFGTSSLYLDGTGDYLTIASGSEFKDFNSKPFTIEGWFYCTEDSTSDYQILMSTGTGSSNWRIVLRPSDKLFEFYDGFAYQTTSAWTVNTWHHFAICGDGTNVRQFIDGSQIRSDSNSNLTAGNTNLTIGVHPGGSTYYFTGYLDDLRIIKGLAKYTANFTAPTSALGTEISATTTTETTDTKSLSSTWTMTNDGSSPRSFDDMRLDNTWANN